MTKLRQRKPRFKRVRSEKTIQITERDLKIFVLLMEHRFLQSHQLGRLVEGSTQHLLRRLETLFHHGRVNRPATQQFALSLPQRTMVYSLSESGRKEMKERNIPVLSSVPRIRAKSTAHSLTHDLLVSEFMSTLRSRRDAQNLSFDWIHATTNDSDLRIMKWSCRISHRNETKYCSIVPDAAFSLAQPDTEPSVFFLEFDRGTMPISRKDLHQSSFLRKIIAYKETRKGGILWKKYEISGFRILVVTESRKRMASLQAATAQSFSTGKSNMFLFAVLDEIQASKSILSPTWETCHGSSVALITDADRSVLNRSMV